MICVSGQTETDNGTSFSAIRKNRRASPTPSLLLFRFCLADSRCQYFLLSGLSGHTVETVLSGTPARLPTMPSACLPRRLPGDISQRTGHHLKLLTLLHELHHRRAARAHLRVAVVSMQHIHPASVPVAEQVAVSCAVLAREMARHNRFLVFLPRSER